jgi:hypothetical protein
MITKLLKIKFIKQLSQTLTFKGIAETVDAVGGGVNLRWVDRSGNAPVLHRDN